MTPNDNMTLIMDIAKKNPHMKPSQLFEVMKAAGVDDSFARAFTDGMEAGDPSRELPPEIAITSALFEIRDNIEKINETVKNAIMNGMDRKQAQSLRNRLGAEIMSYAAEMIRG